VNGVAIEPAARADVPAIHAMIRELAEYERLEEQVVGTAAALEEHLFGPHPAAEAVIAKADGEPVGFALFSTTFSTFLSQPGLWLEDLFVRPEHRGRGTGKLLLRHLAQIALERGYGRIEWAALDWNEPALGFYKGIGAQPIADWITHRLDADGIERLVHTS